MDAAQWPQELGLVKPMEVVSSTTTTLVPSTTTSNKPQMFTERRIRPQKEKALNCPRCNSTNTKFCYYNNYNLAQPRYFCKACRRYWTEGGSLRNVPVGGGSRKNKRHSSSSSASFSSATTTTTTTATEALVPVLLSNNSLMPPHDLNLAFNHHASESTRVSAMELMRSEISGRPLGTFLPMQMSMHEYQHNTPAFGLPTELRAPAALGFHLDSGSGASVAPAGINGRVLFPFKQLKTEEPLAPSNPTDHAEQNKSDHQQAHDLNTQGFWHGMINGDEGSW